jgi:hypothetical protein
MAMCENDETVIVNKKINYEGKSNSGYFFLVTDMHYNS